MPCTTPWSGENSVRALPPLPPVVGDVDTAAEPHAIVGEHVVDEASQCCEAAGPADQPAVQADVIMPGCTAPSCGSVAPPTSD